MNDRKPICLLIATLLLVVEAALIAHQSLKSGQNNMGTYPADFPFFLFVFLPVCILNNLLGLALVIASLLRHEKFRLGAYACLALFLIPLIIFAIALSPNAAVAQSLKH